MSLLTWLCFGALVTAAFVWIYRKTIFETDPGEPSGPKPALADRIWICALFVALFAAVAMSWPLVAFELIRDWRHRSR